MLDEEDTPKPRRLTPYPLDPLGIGELGDYISELRAEISRAEAAIQRKEAHRGEVDRFFRK